MNLGREIRTVKIVEEPETAPQPVEPTKEPARE